MDQRTTIAVQAYLDKLADGTTADPVVRELLSRSANRLHMLCSSLLFQSYPRLTRPPLNLQADEMLSRGRRAACSKRCGRRALKTCASSSAWSTGNTLELQ